MFDIKSQLEAALKAHLDSLPEGGDIPPPAVDPTNVTGVNDPDKPELHIATPNGPQKAPGPLAAQQFQGLHPDARAKVADTGNAPRGYRSPVATNAALASTIKGANAPKVSQGEDAAEPPQTESHDFTKVLPEGLDLTSPPPVAAQKAAPPPGQASSPGSGGPLASGDMQAAQDASRRGRMIAGIGEVADSMAHQPMNLADYAISRGGGHPIETGPDTHAWDRIRADSDRPLAQLAQKLQMQRQSEQDALNKRKTEAGIAKDTAEAGKFDREPGTKEKAPLYDPEQERAALKLLYPDARAAIDKIPATKEAMESAKATFQADRNNASQERIAGVNANRTHEFGMEDRDAEEARKVANQSGDTELSLKLIARQKALIHQFGRNLIVPTTPEERKAQVEANSISGQLGDLASKSMVDANRMPNQAVLENLNQNIVSNPTKFGIGKMLDGEGLQEAALNEYEKTLRAKNGELRRIHSTLNPKAQQRVALPPDSPAPAAAVRFQAPNGKHWEIPPEALAAFKKAHPEAVEVK